MSMFFMGGIFVICTFVLPHTVCRTQSTCLLFTTSPYLILVCRTLTTPVQLIKCLKSIREHAFVASDYPVVITLEDHLTPDLQAKVAEVMLMA